VAELPPLDSAKGQRGGGPVLSAARAPSKRFVLEGGDRPFWSTVNVCDTEASPNALGVRTSVPGNGSDERIYARYTAQWWSGAQQEWRTVGGSGVTDWVYIGPADMTARQAGWTFRFVQPPAGSTYVMRGAVELEWRDVVHAARKARNSRRARKSQRVSVVRQRTLLTETGVTGVQGGDPAGASKAMCLIW
jgi:hypothetical protein